tara:strand:+ start:11987 stop:12214 length:228 start_codon:yes stop_codon:yes gene_type:complete
MNSGTFLAIVIGVLLAVFFILLLQTSGWESTPVQKCDSFCSTAGYNFYENKWKRGDLICVCIDNENELKYFNTRG